MTMTPEPFLDAEIAYRQQHLAEQFHPTRVRRYWVPRRPTMKLPSSRPRLVSLAFGE